MRKKTSLTIVERAMVLVPEFKSRAVKLEHQVVLRGQSASTLNNYIRRIALFVIHFEKMSGMAQCWSSLLETRKIDELSFYEGLQLLLQAEKNQRKENRNTRLISAARFRYQVTIEELNFDAARGLERGKIMQMATGEYIKQGAPILITGATGTGKSWLGTALGYHACLMGQKVAYFNIQKLFETITLHRVEATLSKFFQKMANMDLLIIDDFGVK